MENIKIPEQFEFLFKPRRNKIMYGGRDGAKSYNIAQTLLVRGVSETLRILCTREFQNSIADSVHKLLSDLNDKHQLGYTVTNNSVKHPDTGTEFLFYGLKTNITKIKSLEAVDICWVEEAETISERSLEVLIPTIRKQGSEIWMSFNPYQEDDAVYKKYITPNIEALTLNSVFVDSDHYILRTGYQNNPFLSETSKLEIATMKKRDYRKFQHIYGGEPMGDDENCIIKPEWFDAVIDAHKHIGFTVKGAKVIGLDPADEGNDSKASVQRHGPLVTKIRNWQTGNLEEAVSLVYDAIGIGAGAKIKFKQLDPNEKIALTSFVGGAKVRNPLLKYQDDQINGDMFRNLRAQYYWLLRDRFELTYRAVVHGEYCDPNELISISSDCEFLDELKSELTKIQRKRSNTSSMILIESKQDMKGRGIKSPNIADALVYAFADNGVAMKKKVPNINFVSNW